MQVVSVKIEVVVLVIIRINTRGIQKVKAIFKLRCNRDKEESAHCAVLPVPVEGFSHLQYSAPPSVEWQQRGRTFCYVYDMSQNPL